MYLCYIDESGDDGYPKTSSSYFVLSGIYFKDEFWLQNFEKIKEFRNELKKDYQFESFWELHTKDFLHNKKPYSDREYAIAKRREILDRYVDLLSKLERVQSINVYTDKTALKIVRTIAIIKCLKKLFST